MLKGVHNGGDIAMNTDTDERRAYVEAIMNRLRRQYADRTVMPTKVEDEGATLSLQMLQRLYRHVMSEGYGE
jgi:hypothetical protein